MPWISLEEGAGPEGPHGGAQPCEQRIRCDLCSRETANAYWGPKNARAEAGVYWPKAEEHQGEEGDPPVAWCPECASRRSQRASSSYQSTGHKVEAVMSKYWPTGGAVVPGNTVAKAHPGRLQLWPGEPGGLFCRVPPKAPPPGISSLPFEERLAALEEEVARLRRRVAELEGHSSGAATSSAPPSGTPRLLD